MKNRRAAQAKIFSAVLVMLLILGCATQTVAQMPQSLPSNVKAYKQVTLWAGFPGMKGTGVHLSKRDVYTIIATGSMDHCSKGGCPHRDVRPEQGWPLVSRIGGGNYFNTLPMGDGGATLTALDSGELYFGYRSGQLAPSGDPKNPAWYGDDAGSYKITIITWENDDYQAIAAFLRQMKQKDPQNKAVNDAFVQAERMSANQVAAIETSKQLEETKKEIQSLQAESSPPEGDPHEAEGPIALGILSEEQEPQPVERPFSEDGEKEKKIAQLEEKLSRLTQQLAQLDGVKREFEDERKKAEALAKELEEKQKREQDLVINLKGGSKAPPVIVIASPAEGSSVEVRIIQLNGVAEGVEGLAKLEIFVNGKPLPERAGERGISRIKDGDPKRFDFKESIQLESGENQITIRATDTQGLLSEKSLKVHYSERRKNVWAVVIGINRYPSVRPLKYAVDDARIFYDHLVGFSQIPRENVTLLLDEEATLTRMRSALGTHLKNKAGKDDMAIIFFAGHGATERDVMSPDRDGLEKYLLPYDADPKDLYATALPMGEISKIFSRIQSERLVFIADSCYSGASGGRTIDISGIRASISEAFLDRIAGGKGRVIITASGANEVSAEDDKLKHGVFTYYLVEGLKGKADADRDGVVTVDEAYQYVSEAVPRSTGQEQHPVKKGTVEGRLILSITK